MNYDKTYLPENFFIAGINYKNTDAATRGLFAISLKQYENILKNAASFDIKELFVLSTCNRTEIYGFAKNASQLIELMCVETTGSIELFNSISYVKSGVDAATHLYNIASGLDSQILGDYEIVGQLKQAVKFSRDHKFIGNFLDRLINSVLQSSREIKTKTLLSTGSVSVSFSAVKYIKEKTSFKMNSKILVIGTGKIGRVTCKNLVDYFGNENITIINRSEEKAVDLALELNLKHAPICQLPFHVKDADIIILATNAQEPILLKSYVENNSNKKIIIDLSIPCNVETGVNELPNITLIHVDQISKIKDESLKMREAEVPKARSIIAHHVQEFIEWHEMRKHVPVLKAIKTNLKELHTQLLFSSVVEPTNFSTPNVEKDIQHVINNMANKMRTTRLYGCPYIEAINEFLITVSA